MKMGMIIEVISNRQSVAPPNFAVYDPGILSPWRDICKPEAACLVVEAWTWWEMKCYFGLAPGRRTSLRCGTRTGKELCHYIVGKPISTAEPRGGIERGKPVGATDPLVSREPPSKPVTNDRPHFFWLRGRISPLLTTLPDSPITDSNRPVIKQIATDHDFVAAMTVFLRADGLQRRRSANCP